MDELTAMTKIADVTAWIGMDAALMDALAAVVGKPTLLRHVAVIPKAVWENAIGDGGVNVRVAGTGDATRQINAIEYGMIQLFKAVCRLKMGMKAEEGAVNNRDHREHGREWRGSGAPATPPPWRRAPGLGVRKMSRNGQFQ